MVLWLSALEPFLVNVGRASLSGLLLLLLLLLVAPPPTVSPRLTVAPCAAVAGTPSPVAFAFDVPEEGRGGGGEVPFLTLPTRATKLPSFCFNEVRGFTLRVVGKSCWITRSRSSSFSSSDAGKSAEGAKAGLYIGLPLVLVSLSALLSVGLPPPEDDDVEGCAVVAVLSDESARTSWPVLFTRYLGAALSLLTPPLLPDHPYLRSVSDMIELPEFLRGLAPGLLLLLLPPFACSWA